MKSKSLLHQFLLLLLLTGAAGHAAMSFPKPRNSLDGALAPWTDWAYPCDDKHKGENCSITFCENGKNCEGSCPITARSAVSDELTAINGQSCYWFSNGCTIGCDQCDGTTNHVGHGTQQWLFKGMNASTIVAKNITLENPWDPSPGEMTLDPHTTKTIAIKSNCGRSTKATVCDSRLRTCNSHAECNGPEDIYQYSPWRAPGSAPVIDACGVAGGRFPGQGTGGAGAQYQNTSIAKQGDMGSQLPQMVSQATWQAGTLVEVGWTVMANHGGGYAYRLAPADAPLTEASFRKLPLDFVGKSILRWGGNKSSQLEFEGDRTSAGTIPAGSMWSRNPIPSGLWAREGPQFAPKCQESDECKDYTSRRGVARGANKFKQGVCRCSGYSNGGPLLPNLEVVDRVMIPRDLPVGRYVVQWRWDCEESDQIWASCSDVSVTAATAAIV